MSSAAFGNLAGPLPNRPGSVTFDRPDPGAVVTDHLRCLVCRTPMGAADTCSACGWSYAPAADADPELTAPAADRPEEPAPEAAAEPPPEPASEAAVPSQATWGEVAAVLAVGVVPSCLVILPGPVVASAPFWTDAVYLIVTSACIAYVTLYLIRRSGEPWGRFGLERPAGTDLLLGFGMLVIAELVWLVELRLGLPSSPSRSAGPRGSTEYALMVLMEAANGFTEELVTRAYLITRLEVLLRSRGRAVFLAAGAFASYHAYQGLSGLVGAFLFGLAFGGAYLGVRRVWPLALGHALFNLHLDLMSSPP